jgi:hypothetical protein
MTVQAKCDEKSRGRGSVSVREQGGIEVGTILSGHTRRIPAFAWSAIGGATQNNKEIS